VESSPRPAGALVCAEALVRWQHPTGGLARPDALIPLAERTGLIEPLTRYVLNSALSQARACADAGRSLQVAVNISARSLLDEGLPELVAHLLDTHDVPASLLKLEITESAMFAEPARAQRLMRQLASLGVSLSIDDFGSGYTSLGQLKDLPVSELKIDRSFVTAMSEHRNDGLIVQSVVELGHNLGLTIVAEGVENGGSLTSLANLGCDVAQGYYLAPPMPVDTFDLWSLSQPAPQPEPSHSRDDKLEAH
jgi:EAL domain-containing protein (putative c-di-GMP-specific phosphodiesterase class I)